MDDVESNSTPIHNSTANQSDSCKTYAVHKTLMSIKSRRTYIIHSIQCKIIDMMCNNVGLEIDSKMRKYRKLLKFNKI